jgi:hypothetical protein
VTYVYSWVFEFVFTGAYFVCSSNLAQMFDLSFSDDLVDLLGL